MKRASHTIVHAFALAALWSALLADGLGEAPSPPRGGRVGWARLITPNPAWNRHAAADATFTAFIRRETSLNIDPTWYSVDPAKLDRLCAFPLIFTNSLTDVQNPRQLENIAEYLRRGGFLLVDACINTAVTPDPDQFLKRHVETFTRLFPQAIIRPLPSEHEIYGCYFAIKETPPHSYMDSIYSPQWHRHGLYGVFDGGHMIALLSLSGLQCGWWGAQHPNNATECMEMAVNIYVYAMTRSSDAPAKR